MKTINLIFGFSLAVISGSVAPAVMAQDTSGLTAAELEALFAKQKTRGLVIIPVNQDEADASENADTQANATEVLPDPAYVPVDQADQVNIRISFDFDSAALRENQKPKMATLCQVMKSSDIKLFQIVGHTDSSGSAAYNQSLSLLRAQEVKRFMVNECGIDEHRLVAIGVGESAPYDVDNPAADINRRVEFQALG